MRIGSPWPLLVKATRASLGHQQGDDPRVAAGSGSLHGDAPSLRGASMVHALQVVREPRRVCAGGPCTSRAACLAGRRERHRVPTRSVARGLGEAGGGRTAGACDADDASDQMFSPASTPRAGQALRRSKIVLTASVTSICSGVRRRFHVGGRTAAGKPQPSLAARLARLLTIAASLLLDVLCRMSLWSEADRRA